MSRPAVRWKCGSCRSSGATGDAWAQAFVERAGTTLARIAGLMVSLYDPERIVVAGAAADGLGPVIEIANELLPRHLHGPAPRIVASRLGAGVVATGAVMAALEAAGQGILALSLGGGRG